MWENSRSTGSLRSLEAHCLFLQVFGLVKVVLRKKVIILKWVTLVVTEVLILSWGNHLPNGRAICSMDNDLEGGDEGLRLGRHTIHKG
ncbi:hypothetical protein R1flu_023212 [Riccia fluitans]|uniref:Uncharacterized protein n=1 Tax=Riccia fluitans TaxID=41844 RepID=A0ABD1XRG5_9MARC